jgi:hypothetical protein
MISLASAMVRVPCRLVAVRQQLCSDLALRATVGAPDGLLYL